ncbi:MAG: YdcF family protein [Deltaproteobacteria bacterium]|nr:YdcF family protein [Deltaproteobacteria bacterium]
MQMATVEPGRGGPASAIVVLGARAYADGSPSLALSDRVDEGVRAYREGLAPRLIFTGGIDRQTGVSEPQVMRALAVRSGVPDSAIVLDEAGDTTAASARNVGRLLAPGTPVLVVTHYFHLPRASLLLERRGLRVAARSARMTRRLLLEPWFVAREIPAMYVAWITG